MKLRYYPVAFIALLAIAFVGTKRVQAQSPLVVEWADENGFVVNNALRDAILNDTDRPDDRVYVLKRGGFYWLEDRIAWDGYHLRLRGETAEEADPAEAFVCGPNFDQDCGPAIIQRVARADAQVDAVMLQNTGSGSHLTAENIWFMGQDDQGGRGTYEQMQFDAVDSRLVFDNVVFDRNDWHFLGPNAEGNDLFIRNSLFRNLFGPTQQWEGLGFRFEVGADSVVIENNTFLNIGFTPFQSEAAPMQYFLVNHNTFVNVGRSFSAGTQWVRAFVTNNVFVNPFWHGEGYADYNPDDNPDRESFYTGFFGIGALPAQYGADAQREIVLANNSYWRDPAFAAYYADSIRAQPLVNDTTQGYFDTFEAMLMQDNYIDANPELTGYPADLVPAMIQHISDLRAGVTPATRYYYDPGRDENSFVNNIWPVPEDFSYTNETLRSGGTDGLPLGDLNWFPDAREQYLANREDHISDIESLVAGLELEPIEIVEAEHAVLGDNAEVQQAEGFKHFFMQGAGTITWTFNLEEAGTYALNVQTNLRGETQRGQHIRLDGTGLRNSGDFGEWYFCNEAEANNPDNANCGETATPHPADTWVWEAVTADRLIADQAGALDLEAGEHTVQIAPSWGWQGFSGLQILDAGGNVVHDLSAANAVTTGVELICDEADYCPSGFNSVLLNAGGSVDFNFDAPESGQYLFRIFYQAPDGTVSASLDADGEEVLAGIELTGEAGDLGGRDIFTDQFPLTEGVHTLTLSSAQGGARIDFVQLVYVVGTTISTEQNELPEGYALDQNYPNPFNPVTTIQYELGAAANVTLEVYDLLGRKVMTLVDGQRVAGVHRVTLDGAGLASGVYFYHLKTPVGQQVRRMVLLK